jgi:hypothetical protein
MAKVKIVALLPLYRFGLPQSEGQEVELDSKQAEEIIEAGYAEKKGKDVKNSAEDTQETKENTAEETK